VVIAVFADIAMAIEADFDRYVGVVMGVLQQAGEVNIQTDDEDMVDYINSLRESILEAYTGIIQVMRLILPPPSLLHSTRSPHISVEMSGSSTIYSL